MDAIMARSASQQGRARAPQHPGLAATGALIPLQHLKPRLDAPAGTWVATGADPQFVLPCRLPAGWARLHLKMACARRAQVELFVDTGAGFRADACIQRDDFVGTYDREFFVNLPRPAVAVRLDPVSCEGEFRLLAMTVKPVSRLRMLSLALRARLNEARAASRTLATVGNSLSLLARGRLAEFKRDLLSRLNGPSAAAPPHYDAHAAYQAWRVKRRLTDTDRLRLRAQAAAMTSTPCISILLASTSGSERYLRLTVESVLRQTYPHWELCIADDGPAVPRVRLLVDQYRQRDPRIKLRLLDQNWGPAAVANAALDLARGDFVALLDSGDELAEHALFAVAEALADKPGADLIYSDEDKLDGKGRHLSPLFKPDWSPESLLACLYTGRLAVYRADLVRAIGGFRREHEDAREYDLALRVVARAARIEHIPDVLYHRRLPAITTHAGRLARLDSLTQIDTAGRRALEDFLGTTGRPGTAEPGAVASLHKVRFALQSRPRVSIIVATAYRQAVVGGQPVALIARCLASIVEKSTYANFEIVVLDNDEGPEDLLRDMERRGVMRVPYEKPFNWSAAMNRGAALASGTHFLFLNDDTEVISPDWLEALLEFSQQPEIGAVGARLLFPDGRLQHAGIVILNGCPVHPFYGQPGDHPGYEHNNLAPRNCSAVTGACLMTRADVFRDVGGFTEALDLNYNDIDYCLKVSARGRRIVFTPYAELVHHEAATKPGLFRHELNVFMERWRKHGPRDPYYNPNFSTRFADYRIDENG
jgi:GT2 family glycosyltransferase